MIAAIECVVGSETRSFADADEMMRFIVTDPYEAVAKDHRAARVRLVRLGQWLVAAREHVAHGRWISTLRHYGINLKRAERAVKAAALLDTSNSTRVEFADGDSVRDARVHSCESKTTRVVFDELPSVRDVERMSRARTFNQAEADEEFEAVFAVDDDEVGTECRPDPDEEVEGADLDDGDDWEEPVFIYEDEFEAVGGAVRAVGAECRPTQGTGREQLGLAAEYARAEAAKHSIDWLVAAYRGGDVSAEQYERVIGAIDSAIVAVRAELLGARA